MLLTLISQCQTKHIERNLSFGEFWTCSVLPDHWRAVRSTMRFNGIFLPNSLSMCFFCPFTVEFVVSFVHIYCSCVYKFIGHFSMPVSAPATRLVFHESTILNPGVSHPNLSHRPLCARWQWRVDMMSRLIINYM